VPYRPPAELLDRYADILVNFGLGNGRGVRSGDVVQISAGEEAKSMYVAVRDAVLRAGASYIGHYAPSGVARGGLELASIEQLSTFHRAYYRGLAATVDHHVSIRSTEDPRELDGVDPRKLLAGRTALQPYREWLDRKEAAGRYSWTLASYGTPAMAREARLGFEEYWRQIIAACFLEERDPIRRWREVARETDRIRRRLDRLEIESVHVEGEGIDLHVTIGARRRWLGTTGHNIPSFEIFTSPDWRGTHGTVEFNEPLYRYGSRVEGIRLEFSKGEIVQASASGNDHLLQAMLETDSGSRRIGEFSLTDGRLSPITRFMADTLYDENRGGPEGNFHLAVGNAYLEGLAGEPAGLRKRDWARLGFNRSSVHTDIVSTVRRRVTARLPGGRSKVIYRDGRFTV
jgi:aminopeptidase